MRICKKGLLVVLILYEIQNLTESTVIAYCKQSAVGLQLPHCGELDLRVVGRLAHEAQRVITLHCHHRLFTRNVQN